MADKKEPNSSDEPEKKIPVFTVLKNNTILKNIFVLDKPPLISEPKSIEYIENENQSVQEIEEILVVGRHPDCNITLEHPSISRFHLRIHSKPSSLKLYVIDLSSVHGTWVSGKKLEPGVRVELNEGDTMRLGGSSRVYRLHWIPLSRAYDLENPFVSPSDALVAAEEIEETHQDENCLFAENEQIQSLGNDLVLCSLFSDENSELSLKKAIPSAPPLPEYLNSSFFDEEKVGKKSPSREESKKSGISDLWSVQLVSESVIDTENEQLEEEKNWNPQTHVVSEVLSEGKLLENPTRRSERKSNLAENSKLSFSDEELENQWSPKENHEQWDTSSLSYQPLTTESLNSCLPSRIDISATEDQKFNKENWTSQSSLATGLYVSEIAQCFPSTEEKVGKKSPSREESEKSETSDLWSVQLVSESVVDAENEQLEEEKNRNPQTHVVSELLSGGKMMESPTRASVRKSNLAENSKLSFSDVELENQWSPKENHEQRDTSSLSYQPLATESLNSCSPGGIDISATEDLQFNKENQTSQSSLATGPYVSENAQCSPVTSEQKPNLPVSFDSPSSNEQKSYPVAEILELIDKQSPLRKGLEQSDIPRLRSGAHAAESVNSSLPGGDVLLEIENQQFHGGKWAPQAPFATGMSQRDDLESPPIRSEKKSSLPSIWSRRGKPASVLHIQTSRSRGVDTDAKVEPLYHENIENELISKALFSDSDGDEEETFTPDKENFTPNTLLLKSMKKMAKAEEIKHSKSDRSSSFTKIVNPNIQPEEEVLAFSEKENQAPKILQERKSVRPALRNRAKSEASVLSTTTRSSKSLNYAQTEEKLQNNSTRVEKRKWNIIVDTTCLLNKESRKALQLLQGLKGTQLIIPRIVIRELDCIKRRGSLFRRTTEISSALEWIEECMVNTKWWIHVQSSVEEGMPVAPTPPASPLSRFSEGSGGFPDGAPSSVPFSAYGSLLEIVTPTAEDHILECALLFRRTKNDGQLVLLSNDVTLKIKAMAEGLLCETAEEFRESLVNPFSDRFLWADSSPRGPTWSCMDDVILRERYSHCPLKKPLRLGDGAKGLKLILLHNSHYRKFSSIS